MNARYTFSILTQKSSVPHLQKLRWDKTFLGSYTENPTRIQKAETGRKFFKGILIAATLVMFCLIFASQSALVLQASNLRAEVLSSEKADNEIVSLEIISDVTELRADSGPASATITVLVKDASGNQVDGPHQVNLYTNVGEFTPSLIQTDGDEPITAELIVPAGTNELIMIWGVLPDTNLLARYAIDARSERMFLPFVSVSQ